jgi:hypothetical protein
MQESRSNFEAAKGLKIFKLYEQTVLTFVPNKKIEIKGITYIATISVY